jgi:hypothetical protein
MGLKLAGVTLADSGVQAAMNHFSANPSPLPPTVPTTKETTT